VRRREFITFLGSTAVSPLAARAQQSDRMRRIGVLTSVAADDPNGRVRIAAFLQGLQQLGWTVGRNVQIEYCWAAGSPDDIYKYAAELVGLTPEVIFAARGTSLGALLQATRAVPIVFAIVPNPVGSGFVDSLPRPGGNTTGFMQFEYSLSGKWLELLKQIAPIRQARIHRQAILSCASPDQPPYWLLFRFLLAPLKRGPVVNALARSVI
jgi:putative tryptophan/tyrosine transport system substrate-binding protein